MLVNRLAEGFQCARRSLRSGSCRLPSRVPPGWTAPNGYRADPQPYRPAVGVPAEAIAPGDVEFHELWTTGRRVQEIGWHVHNPMQSHTHYLGNTSQENSPLLRPCAKIGN